MSISPFPGNWNFVRLGCMDKNFDVKAAKEFLEAKELKEKTQREEERVFFLEKVRAMLQGEFSESSVEVYLVGSILRPYQFYSHSDVDVVVKNFTGDRFAFWTKLESILQRNVEIILFENCPFQEYVLEKGQKIC